MRWINFLGMAPDSYRKGEYNLLKLQDNIAIVKYSSCSEPSKVYALIFENVEGAATVDDIQVSNVALDEVKL